MELRSLAFGDGAEIPLRYTLEGENMSPPLHWSESPEGTREFVLIVQDLDAGSKEERFVHWLLYKIPHHVRALHENLSATSADESGTSSVSLEGVNSFGRIRYDGPKPPSRDLAHRYLFKLYAINTHLNLTSGIRLSELHNAMAGAVLDSAELTGIFHSQASVA